jgi:citrate lyase subunit beta/citryl-CoA lyase
MSAATGDDIWPLRTMLFVPANRPDWIPRAIEVDPDAVILDLDDSVAPSDKLRARGLVRGEVEQLRASGVAAIVKIRTLQQGGLEDVAEVLFPGVVAIILPKTDSPDEVRKLHDTLSYHEGRAGLPHGSTSLVLLCETPEALRFSYEIAKASPRVKGLLGGVGALQGDIAWAAGFRATVEGREQQYIQSKLILDSRAAGAMYPVAGVFATPVDDMEQLGMLIRRAKQLGFACVHLIHPSHVALANEIMRPSVEEEAYYRGLLEALEQGQREGRGAVRYEGAMIDLAMLPTARAVVTDAERYRQRARRR